MFLFSSRSLVKNETRYELRRQWYANFILFIFKYIFQFCFNKINFCLRLVRSFILKTKEKPLIDRRSVLSQVKKWKNINWFLVLFYYFHKVVVFSVYNRLICISWMGVPFVLPKNCHQSRECFYIFSVVQKSLRTI